MNWQTCFSDGNWTVLKSKVALWNYEIVCRVFNMTWRFHWISSPETSLQYLKGKQATQRPLIVHFQKPFHWFKKRRQSELMRLQLLKTQQPDAVFSSCDDGRPSVLTPWWTSTCPNLRWCSPASTSSSSPRRSSECSSNRGKGWVGLTSLHNGKRTSMRWTCCFTMC